MAVTRIGLGLAALINAIEVWSQAVAVTTADGIRMPEWSWLPEPTETAVHAALGIGVFLAVLLTVGLLARPAALGISLLSFGAPLVEQQLYSNHLTLLGFLTLWLAATRCDSAWALRPPAGGQAPVRMREAVPLMTQVSVVYLFTGLVKLNGEFLSGRVIAGALRWDIPLPWCQVLAWLAVATELSLVVGLWLSRWRWLVAFAGLGLHLAIPVMMTVTAQLVPFSVAMLATYPLFLSRPPLRAEERA